MNPRTLAKDKYNDKTYDQLSIRVPKGLRDRYKQLAAERGLSLAALMVKSIDEYVSKHPPLADSNLITNNKFHSSAK